MEQSIKNILSTIDNAIASFQDSIPGIQKIVYDELQPLIKQLQIKNGKLLNNIDNLRLLGNLQNKLEKVIISAEYKKSVQGFVDSFTAVSNLNNEYFSQFNKKYNPKNTLPIIKQLAVESTINDLIGQGLSSNIIDPIKSILQQNITTGGDYVKLQEQLQNHILSNDSGDGNLQRYTKQITTDAIHQYNAQYGETIAQDLQFNWGRYIGSNITTTREFCTLLTKKQWVHKSELPIIIDGNIDGHECKLSKTTGLPVGMIPDTNADNFKVRRGGYNCGHQFFWVPDSSVPTDVKAKFETGGIKPVANNSFEKINFSNELKSKNVKVYNNVEEKMQKLGYTEDEMLNVVGGIFNKDFKGISVQIKHAGNDGIKVIAEASDYHIERILRPDTKEVYNAEFFINSKKGDGNGIKAFVNQVNQLRNLGYVKMRVSAGLSASMNGAITWARFGYKMREVSVPEFQKLMLRHNRKETDLMELMSTANGVDFWRKNAFWFEGEFDLTNGSHNLIALQKYLDEKGFNYELNQ